MTPAGKSFWDSILGPFMTESAVIEWLKITGDGLDRLEQAGQIIRLTTADGESIVPTFQFDTAGSFLPHLEEIWPMLTSVFQPWEAAAWLVLPWTDNDNYKRRPVDILRSGSATEIECVLAAARDDAARLRT